VEHFLRDYMKTEEETIKEKKRKKIRVGLPSVCVIQGGRYEVFMSSDRNECFNALVKTYAKELELDDTMHTDTFISSLLSLAVIQAKRDSRVADLCFDKLYGYSLIVSFGSQPPQAPHIDISKEGGLLFLMMVTDKCPGTLIYLYGESLRCSTSERLLPTIGVGRKHRLWKSLRNAFLKSGKARRILSDYGHVLLPGIACQNGERYEKQGLTNMPRGAVLSLEGGITHAAPAFQGCRAGIFFTASRSSSDHKYNSDKQFSAIVVYTELVSALWDSLEVECRQLMLSVVPVIVYNDTRYGNFWYSIPYPKLQGWIHAMEANRSECLPPAWKERVERLAADNSLFG
jgi:hypothetical protein